MAAVTPGDILQRCAALDGRIAATDQVILEAPDSMINAPFREGWVARLRKWERVRLQCGEWLSRGFNWKWEPILEDWETNQSSWEAKVQNRTGVLIPVAAPKYRPTDETLTTTIQQTTRFPEVASSIKYVAVAVGVTIAGAIALVALRNR